MGTATLLQNINAVIDELALPSLTSVVGSSDNTARQLLALANREGKTVSKMKFKEQQGWTGLVSTSTITLSNGVSAYSLPSDLVCPITATYWDVSHKWQLLGPLSPQEWDVLVYGISPAGPRMRFRIKNGQFNVNPTPAAGDVGNILNFEYYSNTWALNTNGITTQTSFLADTDTYRLDDETMVLGIKWRYLRAKGMDYEEEKAQWFARLMEAMAEDGGTRYLPLDSQARLDSQLLTESNVPDTGFGS